MAQTAKQSLLHFTPNGAYGPAGKEVLVLDRAEGCHVFDAARCRSW